MTSRKTAKGICDDNLVWREMYLRTIRCVVVDRSIHISPGQPGRPTSPYVCPSFSWRCTIVADDGTLLRSFAHNCSFSAEPCLPNDVMLKIPWINPARVNGFWSNLTENAKTLLLEERMKYSEVIRGIWHEHNREHGFGSSTVNLCQCAGHYQLNTLEVPATCKNSKSFKTIVLSKKRTQVKKDVAHLEMKIRREQRAIQTREERLAKVRANDASVHRLWSAGWLGRPRWWQSSSDLSHSLSQLRAGEAKLKVSRAEESRLSHRLNDAITSMKECVMREKEAKEATRMARKKESEEKKAARLAKKEAKKSKKQ